MFSSLLSLALVSLALPYATVASSHGSANHRRHEVIAAAQHNVTDAVETTLHRRGQTYNNARLTYYAVGLGACGKNNVPSDYIVALNSGMYGGGYPGPNCFRPISISYNGKTVSATIMDECPGCPSNGGLDLSEGLFKALAPLDDGVIYASWHFTDEGGDDPAPAPTTHKSTQKPKPTSAWEPPSTSWSQPETTPTSKKSTQHSSTHSSTSATPSSSSTPTSSSTSLSSSSSSSSSSSTPSSSSAAAPAAATIAAGPNTLEKLSQAFVGLSEFMLAGAQGA